jgi:hypothetical protein
LNFIFDVFLFLIFYDEINFGFVEINKREEVFGWLRKEHVYV